MRLLFVHQSFPAQYKHIVRHFIDGGHEVVILRQKLGRDVPGARQILYEVPAEPPYSTNRFAKYPESGLRTAHAVVEQARALKAGGFSPDIMIGHNGWGETLFLKDVWPDAPLVSYFEFFYARQGGDLGFDPEFPPGPEAWTSGRAMNTLNLLGLEAADWGQSPTYWQRSRYPHIHHPTISVIHEGIDTAVVAPKPTIKLTLPNGRMLTRDDEVITYVSRSLEPYRGFHVFLRSLPEILRRRPKAQVLLVGHEGVSYGAALSDGRSYKEALVAEQGKALDLSRVHFLGQVTYEQFLAILQISSAHVYLTYPFVLSWSLMEAMSAGCAVIGSRTPPVEEVVADGVNGLLVDFFDRTGIADRIDQILDHPDRMQAMREAARRTIVEHYDLRRICLPRQLKLIDDLLNHRIPEVPAQWAARVPEPSRKAGGGLASRLALPLAAPAAPPVPPPTSPQVTSPEAASPPPGAVTVDDALRLAREAEDRGDDSQAEAIYRTLVGQKPNHAEAHYRYGLLAHRHGKFEAAARLMERAVELAPTVANYHCDLGVMYRHLKQLDRRLASYSRAVELEPGNVIALTNLASALNDIGDPEAAEGMCRRAIEQDAKAFQAWVNLGSALMHQNRLDDAEKAFLRARNLKSDYAENDKNLGMCLMLKGDFVRGAKYYDGRVKSQTDQLARPYKQPLWDGRKLKGTVFLHSEQGLGDTLHFLRYVPLVKARAGRVVVEVQEPLLEIARSIAGADEIVCVGAEPPKFDAYRSLMSLPHVFHHDLGRIPRTVPYLAAPAARLAAWRERLGRPGEGRLKVGLVWAGNPTHGNDRRRSLTVDSLRPLLELAEVDFHSLQKGPPVDQLDTNALRDRIRDLGSDITDFADTAAALECLDLLISVDTSVAHLAGALGRPVWTLLPFHPDWRWLLEREDSPWYPSMRLFRQGDDRTWGPVLDRLRAALLLRATATNLAVAGARS